MLLNLDHALARARRAQKTVRKDAACYGWPRSVALDDAEIVRRLTELNREISEGTRPDDPLAHLTSSRA